MKIRFVIIVLLILPLFAAGQETVDKPEIQNDFKVTREIFDVQKYPALTAVGRINFRGSQWCSLILVAEDVAVTAGHCFLEANYRFDLSKDLSPSLTSVVFKPNGVDLIENVSVKRVLKAVAYPDYAIIRLNKKIPADLIKPLKILNLTLDEMRGEEPNLGCAGFNGDRELGNGGRKMTISRNIKIVPESGSPKRIDASCFSTYGGSGGLFFEEKNDPENDSKELKMLGVIWGIIDEKFNNKGELVKNENIITTITPVGAFYKDLSKILSRDQKSR